MPALTSVSTASTPLTTRDTPDTPLITAPTARPARPAPELTDPAATARTRATTGSDAALSPVLDAAIGGRAAASPSFLGTRLTALGRDTRLSLVAQRARYAEIIAGHDASIATLETELTAINARIAQKGGQVQSLLAEKQRLTHKIDENRRIAAVATVYGGLLGIFTLGAGAVVGAGIAATGAAALVALRSDLRDAERREGDARRELAQHQAMRANHSGLQSQLRGRVDALHRERDALSALDVDTTQLAPREAIQALEAGVLRDQRTIANLEEQIRLLRAMKGQSAAFELTLDGAINRLEDDVSSLREQHEASRRALFEAVVDIALVAFGATLALKSGGLDPAKKAVLLAGFDVAGGSTAEAVTTLLGKLASEALIVSSGSALLGATLNAAMSVVAGGPEHDVAAEVRALVKAAAGSLSPLHRGLLTLLESVTAFDPRPLAQAVIGAPALDATQAELIRKLLDGTTTATA